MPPLRFSRNLLIGESSLVGSSSSMRLSPKGSIATLTFWSSTVSVCTFSSPRASAQNLRASSMPFVAIPIWSIFTDLLHGQIADYCHWDLLYTSHDYPSFDR